MQLRLGRRLLLGRFVGARLGTLFPVQDIGARHFVLARTHQRELDLVLDVFYMEGPAGRLAAYECAHDRVSQRGNELPDPRRRGALPAFDGQKRLGHRDGDLAGLETHYRTVAADDLVLRKRGRRRNADVSERGRAGNRLWSRYVSRDLHIVSSTLFFVRCPAGMRAAAKPSPRSISP